MKNYMNLAKKAQAMMQKAEVPYKEVKIVVNNRLSRALGKTCYTTMGTKLVDMHIELSGKLVTDECPEEVTLGTIIHEYIHTNDGCHNHGNKFQSYAQKFNKAYPSYKIGTYASKKEEKQLEDAGLAYKETYRYEITCQNCNTKNKYQKKGNVIKHMEYARNMGIQQRCTCGKCGSNNLSLKYL